MFLLKPFSGLFMIGLIYLAFTNPSLEEAKTEVNKRIKENQSAMRAGWGGVTKVTGVDWLSKTAGFGNYELCRKNLIVGSLFVVKDAGSDNPEDQRAVGFGLANRIWGERLIESEDMQATIINTVVKPLAHALNFKECIEFHKSGKVF